MADADGNNSMPRVRITTNDRAIESQQQGQHFPRVGFLVEPAVTGHEATQNNNNNTPPPRIFAGNPSTGGGSLSLVTCHTSPGVVVAPSLTQNNAACTAMSPATPDFSRAQSDVNAYLSGDDDMSRIGRLI